MTEQTESVTGSAEVEAIIIPSQTEGAAARPPATAVAGIAMDAQRQLRPRREADAADRRGSCQEMRAHPAIVGSSGTAGGHEHCRPSFSRPPRQSETLVCARDRELPDHFRMVG